MIGKLVSVIIPTEFISPQSNSTGEYFYQIVERLLEDGHGVKLIAPKSPANYSAVCALLEQFNHGLEVTFISESKDHKGARIVKGINSLMLAIKLWWEAKRITNQTDILFFGTNPTFSVAFLSLLLSAKKNKKVLLAYDIFPDNLLAISSSGANRFIGLLLKPIFKRAYIRLDKTLVIGRCMKERLLKWGVRDEKITVVSNWADENELVPSTEHLKDSTTIEFQFLGNLGPLQGIELLLKAIPMVKSQTAAFSFYGRGAYVRVLEEFIANNPNATRVRFGGEVSRNQRNEILNQCDVAIVSLDKRVTGLGVPSKSYFSLAVGKPLLVIAGIDSEPARLVHDDGLGWAYTGNEPKQLAELIDTICSSWTVAPKSDYIRDIFLQKFSKSVGTRVVVDEIVSIRK